jgi:hypothetical protein
MVALVLIGVRLRERRDGGREGLARSHVPRDGRGVPGASVGACQARAAGLREHEEALVRHLVDGR